jgi:hypothetical protein
MATFTNQLTVHNEWTLALNGIWINYKNDNNFVAYYDFPLTTPLAIGADMSLAPPDKNIISETNVTDHWTITWLDSEGRLWGTAQLAKANISHYNGMIEAKITAIDGGQAIVVLIMPGGDSVTLDAIRL